MNIVARKKPIQQNVYSLRDIIDTLELRDSPFLMVSIHGYQVPIQTNSLSDEDILSVPGVENTEWLYLRTTEEWIPVFLSVDDTAIMQCIDYKRSIDTNGYWWVTFKGFSIPQ